MKQKLPIQASVLAQTLFNEFIESKSYDPTLELIASIDALERYNEALRLSALGIMLTALIDEEHRNPKFVQVREAFEKLVFPEDNAEAVIIFNAVKNQMREWQNLFKTPARQLTWTKSWFSNIGITLTNPDDLTLFVVYLMDFHIAIMDSLLEFEPYE